MSRKFFPLIFVLAHVLAASSAPTAVRGLPSSGTNDFYTGNRSPLLPSPLVKLPAGCVAAAGWLRRQLELMAGGFTGHLDEVSKFCKYDGNAWTDPKGQGTFGWEEVPYWLKGFVDLGYLTGDVRIQNESRRWIEAVLRSQLPNGYFGSRANLADADSGAKLLDLWPNMVMLYPLRTYYEATGDARVLAFMTHYFRWQTTVPLDRFLPSSWQKWRGGDNLDSVYWLYNHTGEAWLLDLARVNHERTADWTGGIPTWHGVNFAECFREPAQYFQQSLDRRYLDSTKRDYNAMMDLYGQFPGGMYAADENARPGFSGPRQAAETCAMVEMMNSSEMLLRITGDAGWADHAEDVAFNSLPASMTADLKALHYLTAANQVQLDRSNKAPLIDNGGDQFSYNPYQYRCCQHNVAFGWPYFTENLWLATRGNGLAAAIYAPGKVTAKVGDGAEVTIVDDSNYPFSPDIALRLSSARPVRFPLSLRLPAWCAKPTLAIDGMPVAIPSGEENWVTVTRTWRKGDTVLLHLPMDIHVRHWPANHGAVSIERGPLTYSLKIAERWSPYNDDPRWPAYDVYAASPWNYALVLDGEDSTGSLRFAENPHPGLQPFAPDETPSSIRAHARRVAEWKLEPDGLVGQIQRSPVKTSAPVEEVTLIPMGAARLRIASFPEAAAGGERGTRWQENPPVANASHAWHFHPPSAMDDGTVGGSSSDAGVPWFVWWNCFGTAEWAEYSFSKARRIEGVEVYWADEGDRSAGGVGVGLRLAQPGDGAIRLPQSWKVVYWDGAAWKSPVHASPYSTNKNAFNRVTFHPVSTTKLRVEAQLERGDTAGIVEWRVRP